MLGGEPLGDAGGIAVKAESVTLRMTIRPSYSEAKGFKAEVEESLDWLRYDHHACEIEWLADGEGEWPNPEEDDD